MDKEKMVTVSANDMRLRSFQLMEAVSKTFQSLHDIIKEQAKTINALRAEIAAGKSPAVAVPEAEGEKV